MKERIKHELEQKRKTKRKTQNNEKRGRKTRRKTRTKAEGKTEDESFRQKTVDKEGKTGVISEGANPLGDWYMVFKKIGSDKNVTKLNFFVYLQQATGNTNTKRI